MLSYVLFVLFILSCFVLVVAVLLQPGKADAGALFTSSVSSTAFGPRGTQTLLAKITIVAAITFMLSALMISFNIGGTRSVVAGEPEGPAAPQQQQQTPAPQTNASPAAATEQPAGDAGAAQNAGQANTDTGAANNTGAANANSGAGGGNGNTAGAANTSTANTGAATNAQPQGSPR